MKKLFALVLIVAMAFSFIACQAAPAPTAEEEAPAAEAPAVEAPAVEAPAAPGEKTTITIEAIASSYGEAIMDLVDQDLLDELNVELAFTYGGTVDAYSKQMMEFSQGASTYDIVLFEPAWLGDYGPHLEPVEPLAQKAGVDLQLDDIISKYRDIYATYNGTQVTVPFDGDQFNLFYNTQAFSDETNKADFQKAYGYELVPPTTWDQYADIATFFNGRDWDNDGKPEYGTSEAWLSGGYAYWWFMARFAAYGGLYFDEKHEPPH